MSLWHFLKCLVIQITNEKNDTFNIVKMFHEANDRFTLVKMFDWNKWDRFTLVKMFDDTNSYFTIVKILNETNDRFTLVKMFDETNDRFTLVRMFDWIDCRPAGRCAVALTFSTYFCRLFFFGCPAEGNDRIIFFYF